jgi:Polysulphide reductase, NrfD
MSRVPLPYQRSRVPDLARERRLEEIRREGGLSGAVKATGIVPVGAPFPQATAETGYYGIPLLKEPQWQKEVPLYFFVGGAAGASAVVACAADLLSDNQELVRNARWMAAVGGMLSGALLTKDLGVPSRFINMLRVFKLQSPMNVGAWTLSVFSTFSAAAAFANQMRQKLDGLPILLVERLIGMLASATGLVMASYTGVLIGGTAIPVWNRNIDTLPLHFAASGMNSAVSILELIGDSNSRALNILGLASSAYECLEGLKLETQRTMVNEPLRKGVSGFMVRAGGVLSGPVPFFLRLAYAITGNRELRRAAAYSSLAGSLFTRFGWVQAGRASAKDHRIPLGLSEKVPKVGKPVHQLARKTA